MDDGVAAECCGLDGRNRPVGDDETDALGFWFLMAVVVRVLAWLRRR